MNIVFLIAEYTPNINGGLGRYAENISAYLIKKGQYLNVFTLNTGILPVTEFKEGLRIERPIRTWLKRLLFSKNITKWRYLNFLIKWINIILYNFDSFKMIKKLHHDYSFDLIAVHDWMSGFAGILCCLFSDIPVVFHIHNTEFTMTKWGRDKDFMKIIWVWERLLSILADKIIVPTEEMRNLLITHKWDPHKIEIVCHGYNPVFSNEWASSETIKDEIVILKKNIGISEGEKVLVFAGRLAYMKGVFDLIRAVPVVIAQIPKIKLILIGDGEIPAINQEITNLVSSLGLTNQIYIYHRFLTTKEVMLHYMMADLCIFPSKYEPFGLVALEAMSLGKPVILGKGFSRIFAGSAQKPAVVFVANDSPGDIAKCLLNLLHHPEDARQIGKNAKDFVYSNFDWAKTVTHTLQVYSNTIKDVSC